MILKAVQFLFLLSVFCSAKKEVMSEWEVILDELNVAEGLAFSETGKLYVTEVLGGRLMEYDLKTKTHRVIDEQTGKTNGLAFDAEGNLWGASMEDKCLYQWLAPDFMTRKRFNTGVVMNDLVIDGDAIFFTDTEAKKVHLFSIPTQQFGEVIQLPFSPNGIALNGEQLLIADFFGDQIYSLSVEERSAALSPFLKVPISKRSKQGGLLDGMEMVDHVLYLSTIEGVKVVDLISEKPMVTWLKNPKEWKRACYVRVNKKQTLMAACFVDKVVLLDLTKSENLN